MSQDIYSKPSVFFSYSHDDSELVEKIAERIQNAGFSCWIDKQRLRAQERFNSAIDEAIDDAIVFLAFLSKTYVNKPYCIHEFDRAIDKKKSILTVCIDEVSEQTNRQSAYLFAFSAGHNILGFGTGIRKQEEIDSFCGRIMDSVPMEQLQRYLKSGDSEDYPPISTPDYIVAQLRLYHQKQYRQSGNYALYEIRNELFPAIRDAEIHIEYKDEKNENVSLIKYFSKRRRNDAETKHILITGEGGMGKTVSLLKTCEYLLSRRVNAIYIPLSKIDAELTLDQYLERTVCGGNQQIWGDIKKLMSAPYKDVPNVVLLLDGINEVASDYVERFIKREIKSNYIDSYCGVQLVMTSRWLDSQILSQLKEDAVLLEMQPLHDESIELYLKNMNLPAVEDKKILSVIRTPLMLTLFADVERHKVKYQNIKGICLEEHPDTVGKILGNFFQTQLYRAAGEENFDRGAHLVLLEYLLPKAAFFMVKNQSQYIKEKDLRKCINGMKRQEIRFQWYLDDEWCWKIRGRSELNLDVLRDIAESGLHFLNETDEGFEFLHQSFRDYFAAYYLANEMRAFAEDDDRFDKTGSLLEEVIYPKELMSLVSDIVREEDAQPKLTEQGWEFPGKKSTEASKYSLAENLLSLWRGKSGESAQNAVANLLQVMKFGRRKNLAWCDFSKLDLRACWLNNCRFAQWYREKVYSSVFDGAWIDRGNFLTNGHEAKIRAIMSDEDEYLFTGDENGTVKIYHLTEGTWYDTFQLQSKPVVDLAWDCGERLLAVLYENIVFCYSPEQKKVVGSIGNNSKSKDFRYVRFTEDQKLNISFNVEPLVWYDMDGNVVTSDLKYDVPAACARWNPKKKEFIRSNLLQMLSVNVFDESSSGWKLHPALQGRYISLRDAGALGRRSVSSIQYHPDGTKVLVTIENLLIEYDTESFLILNKKKFSTGVWCACYIKNGIAAGVGSSIVLLDPEFSENQRLRGVQIKPISIVSESYEDDDYYLFSANGEIKKLNSDLIVQNMRAIGYQSQFVWCRDRLSGEIQMAFLPSEEFPYGSRYTYETDFLEPLGWRYEFVDLPVYTEEDEQRFYKLDSSLMVVERIPPYKKIIFPNYTGIWIFGCSFQKIQGDMAEEQNKKFLIQNGGIVDVDAE